MDNEIENLMKSERGLALLGIATHQSQSSTTTECVPDEQIISFISHNVTKKQREKIFAHLNRCSNCYNNWLETASYIAQKSPSTDNKWWNFQIPMWQPLVTSVAATILVIVTVITLLPSNVNNSIDQNYQLVKLNANNDYEFQLGFNFEANSSASQAFQAGIESGQAELNNEIISSAWRDSQWATEYALGRWFILLKIVATQSVANDFWKQQVKLLQKFESSEYSSNDDMKKTIMQALSSIKPLLLVLQADPNNIYQAEQLSAQIEIVMANMAGF